MPGIEDIFKGAGEALINPTFASKKFMKGAKGIYNGGGKEFLFGSPEVRENVSNLRPEQEGLYNQAVNAGMGKGAGGAFGEAADYYRGNLSENPQDMNAFAAPELRRYNEETVPGLSEQFAGMGAGGLSSSGFRNSQVQGATDLSERLAQIRANLRQSSAQGLQNIGQTGLNQYSNNMVTKPGSTGLVQEAIPAALAAGAGYFGGPGAAQATYSGTQNFGHQVGNWMQNSNGGNKVGNNTSPYSSGNGISASPQMNQGRR